MANERSQRHSDSFVHLLKWENDLETESTKIFIQLFVEHLSWEGKDYKRKVPPTNPSLNNIGQYDQMASRFVQYLATHNIMQCDQLASRLVQFLAFYDNENLLNRIKIGQSRFKILKILKPLRVVCPSGEIIRNWSHWVNMLMKINTNCYCLRHFIYQVQLISAEDCICST